jgi:SAM-dependent methyltransferase
VTLDRVRKGLHHRALRVLGRAGPTETHWIRLVMNRVVGEELERLSPHTLDAVEISGRVHEMRPWKSYTAYDFPDFDLCDPPSSMPQFDVVLCEQVLEHVADPWRAMRTLHDLARPGGYVVATTPFLYRLHYQPDDFWRFTPRGMEVLVRSADLEIRTLDAWGNSGCVKANFGLPRQHRFWQSLRNDPLLPVVVWVIAQRPPR